MTNRTGNSLTAIVIGALAGVTLVIAMNGAAHADACLPGPKGAAPTGSHWYYRVDHATKRNCWYVRAASGKPASHNSVVTQAPAAETPLQPAVANARAEAGPAEFAVSAPVSAAPAPSADANAPAADSAQTTVASRWLDQPSATAAETATPGAADPGASVGASAATVAARPPAAADARPASPSNSIPTLFLVMVGALAAAALVGGVIFRFGSLRRNGLEYVARDQHAPWDPIGVGATIRSPAMAVETPAPLPAAARDRCEAVIPDEIAQLLSTLSKEAAA